MTGQIKTKQRVSEHGEVFTAEREVKAMCDLVKDECERIDSRFLEPACGDGNFLEEVLIRKLNTCITRYGNDQFSYEHYSIQALTSIYGVDILEDNAKRCRERLFDIWYKRYKCNFKNKIDSSVCNAALFIINKNIVCGNALSLMCVDENQKDTAKPIIFTEWTFPLNNSKIMRREFRLDVLLKENDKQENYGFQMSLFSDDASGYENWVIDPVTKQLVPKPIEEYSPLDFRKLNEHEPE